MSDWAQISSIISNVDRVTTDRLMGRGTGRLQFPAPAQNRATAPVITSGDVGVRLNEIRRMDERRAQQDALIQAQRNQGSAPWVPQQTPALIAPYPASNIDYSMFPPDANGYVDLSRYPNGLPEQFDMAAWEQHWKQAMQAQAATTAPRGFMDFTRPNGALAVNPMTASYLGLDPAWIAANQRGPLGNGPAVPMVTNPWSTPNGSNGGWAGGLPTNGTMGLPNVPNGGSYSTGGIDPMQPQQRYRNGSLGTGPASPMTTDPWSTPNGPNGGVAGGLPTNVSMGLPNAPYGGGYSTGGVDPIQPQQQYQTKPLVGVQAPQVADVANSGNRSFMDFNMPVAPLNLNPVTAALFGR